MSQDAPGETPPAGTAEQPVAVEGAPEDGAGAKPSAAAEEGEELTEIEALRREANENQENYLRMAAELENLRKRAARDVENARRYGLERLARALLPVRDSLEAGLAVGEQADADTLLEGKRATLRLLDAALELVGIEELDPEGEPFDPGKHEAMTMQVSETAEPNAVLTVIQKGYTIHDRLLRPARVIVAQCPPEEVEEAEEQG